MLPSDKFLSDDVFIALSLLRSLTFDPAHVSQHTLFTSSWRDKTSFLLCSSLTLISEKRKEDMSSQQQGAHSQGDVSTEILRKQVMVNQFVNAVGCTSEQATHILQSAQWQFEVRDCATGPPCACVYVCWKKKHVNILLHCVSSVSSICVDLFQQVLNVSLAVATSTKFLASLCRLP